MQLFLYTDGGARGNPGPAGIGAVVKDGERIIKKIKKYIGEATNNQAEYEALILGLSELKKIGGKDLEVSCFLDSELVVKQLNFEYKIKNKDLATLFVKVCNLAQSFKKCKFFHVYREQNKEADRLVNEALDEQKGKFNI